MRKTALDVINQELQAIKLFVNGFPSNWEDIINALNKISGKIVITGIGKSSYVARKMAATLSSTGSPSVFMHPAEALHGDVGMLTIGDFVIFISHSGETKELLDIIPLIKKMGLNSLSITSCPDSKLAKLTDFHIDTQVKKEALPLGLPPSTSTTLTAIIGDAIAGCLMVNKEFKEEDYAFRHPAGILGKKLLLKVEDLNSERENVFVDKENSIINIIHLISRNKKGAVCVKGPKRKLLGLITDGDIRRLMEKHRERIFSYKAKDIMNKKPAFCREEEKAIDVLRKLQDLNYQCMPILDNRDNLIGLISVHDIFSHGLR